MTPDDVDAIAGIYAHYVAQTVVTFDTQTPTPESMKQTLAPIMAHYPAYVCVADGVLAVYCYAHPWKTRPAYNLTLETTIYLHPGHTSRGHGRKLLQRLIDECRRQEFHVLVACITMPNDASVALHEALGFNRVSCFREVGRKFGRWLDVADYQLIL